ARFEAGRLGVDARDADLHQVVRDAVDSFRDAARERGLQLEMVAQGDGHAWVDPKRIGQVVFNLLSNAVKFTPQGGKVTVESRQVPSGVRVRVADTGAGIAPEKIPRLFQPFSQVHEPQ